MATVRSSTRHLEHALKTMAMDQGLGPEYWLNKVNINASILACQEKFGSLFVEAVDSAMGRLSLSELEDACVLDHEEWFPDVVRRVGYFTARAIDKLLEEAFTSVGNWKA